MKLSYAISTLRGKQKLELAATLSVDLGQPGEQGLASLVQAMQEESGFRAVWETLTGFERKVYLIAVCEMSSDGFSLGVSRTKLLSTFERTYGIVQDVGDALRRLTGCALLGHTQIWYIGDGYEVPEELWACAYQRIAQEIAQSPVWASPVPWESVTIVQRGSATFVRDLMRLLGRMLKRPVAVTKTGAIYRREAQKLERLLRTKEILDVEIAGRWEGVSTGVYLAVQVLLRLRAVVIGEGQLHLQGARVEELATYSDTTWRTILGAELVSRGIVYGHRHVLGIAQALLAMEHTTRPLAISHALRQVLGVQSAEKGEWETWLRAYAGLLAVAGHVDVGTTGLDDVIVRHAVTTESVLTGGVVQPNLEILIPDDTHPLLHLLAGQIGEVERVDEMSIYRLDRDSILLLCDRGWSLGDVEHAISLLSASPVSPVVYQAVRDWMVAYNRAVVWDVMLVRFQTNGLLALFLADPRAETVVIEAIAPTAVMVKRSAEKMVRTMLADIGAPAPEEVRTGDDERDGKKGRGGAGASNKQRVRSLQGPALLQMARDLVSTYESQQSEAT